MRKKSRRGEFIIVLIVLFGMMLGLGACDKPAPPPVVRPTKPVAKDENKAASPKKAVAAQQKEPAISYNPQGLVDPFKPFIQIGSTSKTVEGIPRTPLQEYDLSQLKLTAIIWMGDEKSCAMVEDSAGKGFTLKKGTYIGKRGGKVKAIQKDRVLVEVPVESYGTTKAQEIVMRMPEEGGEK